MDHFGEVRGVSYMLQGHLAAEEVCVKFTIFLTVQLGKKLDPTGGFSCDAFGNISWVESDTFVAAKATQQSEKFALSTPDLDNLLAVKRMTVNQPSGQVFVPSSEEGRKTLGFFAS